MRDPVFHRVRTRLTFIAVSAMLLSAVQVLFPVSTPVSAKPTTVELPDPRQVPGTPPSTSMEPDGPPPGPPAALPPGADIRKAMPERPVRPNEVVRKTPAEVAEFERDTKTRVVENEDNLFAYDTVDGDGKPLRVALLQERTKSGFPVVGIAFLDETELRAVEKAKMSKKHTSLLGPGVAHAHFTNYGHYHYFFHCSFVYQYPNTWEIYLYVCPTDVSSARAVGGSAATAIGIATGHPWLGWAVGIGINAGIWRIQEADGSIHIYFTQESIYQATGYAYFWGTFNDWFRGFPYGAAYGAFGWAQKWLDGSWWRLAF